MQHFLTVFCVVALLLALLALFAMCVMSPLWGVVRKLRSLSFVEGCLCAAFVFVFVRYAATKPKITFDGGIKDADNRSVVSNNLVAIRWQRDAASFVPTNAAVYIDYRLSVDTNGQWVLLAESTVGAWAWHGIVENATNYDYNVWAYYIPPAPVHTNGIWVYKTLKDRGGRSPIPIRSRVEINGKAISTPEQKRKDEDYD